MLTTACRARSATWSAPRLVSVRQQEREFVAAVAEHEVGVAAGADQAGRDPPQQGVAGLVAALVVDRSEVVEVEHDQAERRALANAPFEPFLERAVVEQAGQVVGPRPDLDRLEDLGVLQGDGDLRREQLDELEFLGGEGVGERRAVRWSGRRPRRRGRAAGRR